MKNKISSLLALLFAACIAQAASIPEYPFVFVNGSAELEIKPDIAEVSLTVRAIDLDPSKAQAVVEARTGAVLELLKKNNIARADIQADSIDKTMETNSYKESGRLVVRGYDLKREIAFKVRALESWPDMAEQFLALPNIEDLKISFTRTDRTKLEAELVTKAAADAREKAVNLAKGFGTTLGAPVAISQRPFDSIASSFGFSEGHSYPQAYIMQSHNARDLLVPATISLSKDVYAIFKLE